jgi:3-oxoacyl-[acyl-carrier protein] reductase
MDKAFITGGSRGIGAEIAKQLVYKGVHNLVLGYNTGHTEAKKVADYCTAHGANVELCQINLADIEDAQFKLKEAITHMGGIDILVNNAGITQDSLALRMNHDRWDSVIDINLKAAFFLSKTALKPMIKHRHGRIINISSIIAQKSRGGQVNYAASKGGLEAMTRALAVEVASRGITVNAIAPGWIDTEMTQNQGDHKKGQGGLESTIPVGKIGQVSDVAHLAAFLSSAEASYITGQVIAVDGGLSVRI